MRIKLSPEQKTCNANVRKKRETKREQIEPGFGCCKKNVTKTVIKVKHTLIHVFSAALAVLDVSFPCSLRNFFYLCWRRVLCGCVCTEYDIRHLSTVWCLNGLNPFDDDFSRPRLDETDKKNARRRIQFCSIKNANINFFPLMSHANGSRKQPACVSIYFVCFGFCMSSFFAGWFYRKIFSFRLTHSNQKQKTFT